MNTSPRLFFIFWTYCVIPISAGLVGFSVFFGNILVNGQQIIFLLICSALIYGLHKRNIWAWYLSWPGFLALAAIPMKFGLWGGLVGGAYILWATSSWMSLKDSFASVPHANIRLNYKTGLIIISGVALLFGLLKYASQLGGPVEIFKSDQAPIIGKSVEKVPQSKTMLIMTWLWSPKSSSSESVIEDVVLNSIEGVREIKITNRSKYEIDEVTLGLSADDTCPPQKNFYREFISCAADLKSNSTKTAYCKSVIPIDAPICLVGAIYRYPYSGDLVPVR